MKLDKSYRILLYYKFVPIENPEEFAAEHLAYCNELELKGRILVANEGINGTVSGTVEQTQQYMDHMHADPRFRIFGLKSMKRMSMLSKKCTYAAKKQLVTFRVEDAPFRLKKPANIWSPKSSMRL